MIDNLLLIKHINIYCNTLKCLYGKLTLLYHFSKICKEQHRKLFPFITFKKNLVDEISFNCESRVSMFDYALNDSYSYVVVNVDEYLNVDN